MPGTAASKFEVVIANCCESIIEETQTAGGIWAPLIVTLGGNGLGRGRCIRTTPSRTDDGIVAIKPKLSETLLDLEEYGETGYAEVGYAKDITRKELQVAF